MGIQINGQTDRISAVDGSFGIQDLAELNISGIVTAASANFTGNVSIGGTLTYQDVTNIDSVGIITARAGVKVPDSQKIFAGTGDDLQIYHDGTNTVIENTTGNLYILDNDAVILGSASGTESYFKGVKDGAAELYYDNSKKFETTTTGATITNDLVLNHASGDKAIRWATGGTNKWSLYHNNNAGALVAYDNANNAERLRIDANGRISVNSNANASDANEGAQLRVTGTPITRNQYYSPAGDYYGSFGYTDNTYTKSWIAVDSSYNKASAVSAGIFLSAFHSDANGSACGHTIKNTRADGSGLIFSSVTTASSTGNPAVETEKMRISPSGVAINKNAAADAELEIVQSADPTIRLHDNRNAAYKADFLMAGSAPIIRTNNTTVTDRTFTVQKGTTDHLIINGNGYVTKPYQPGVYLDALDWSSSNNYMHNGYQFWQVGNHWNNSTGTFTCPVAGKYLVAADAQGHNTHTQTGASNQYANLVPRVNNSNVGLESVATTKEDGSASGGTATHTSFGFTIILSCNANDTIRVHSNHGFRSNTQNHLTIYLLG